jgi:hypothetical protein
MAEDIFYCLQELRDDGTVLRNQRHRIDEQAIIE